MKNIFSVWLVFSFLFVGCAERNKRIHITTMSLPNAKLSESYSESLSVIKEQGRVTWTIEVGQLPNGLNLDSRFGTISGSPITSNTEFFTLSVTDGRGRDQAELSIDVDD